MVYDLHWLTWVIIGIYLIALVSIGLIHSKKSRKDSHEYILAGRRLSLPGFVATLVSTWYGGILGVGENTFNAGIQTWFIFGFPYYVFATLFAVWLAPRIRSSEMVSIPDHLEHGFGKNSSIVGAVYLLFLASPAPYILSIGLLLKFALGIPFGWALLGATFFSLFYIWFGGFGAVIRTDILQFILMFLGFFLVVAYAWNTTGSPLSLWSRLPETHRSFSGGQSIQYIIVWFFIALWTFVDPGFYQRCAAARSPETAKRGILVAVVFWFIFDSLTLLAGLYAKVIVPGSTPLHAYASLGQTVLPPLVFGIFLIGILATIMSTIDSLGFISAITFGRDILWRSQIKTLNSKDMDATRLIQKGLMVMAFIALLLAFSFPSVVKLWYITGSIFVPGLLLPFLLTFTGHSFEDAHGMRLLLIPVLVTLAWMVAGLVGDQYPLNLEPFYPGMAVSIIIGLTIIKK